MSNPFDLSHKPHIGKPLDLAPGLQVVTAPNASPMTFTGTQTYLLGKDAVAIIDPGPEDDTHLKALLNALNGRPLSHILITHSHMDHSPLSRRLSEKTGAPIYAFGNPHDSRSPLMERLAQAGDLGGQEGIDTDFRFDHRLKHGQIIAGDGWELEVIHTPGHLSNHICFANNNTGALFSGDHVMGWATTMVSPPDGDLSAFMASLAHLAERKDDRTYYAGHGAPVSNPLAIVNHLLKHRKSREAQILDHLSHSSATASQIAKTIYTDVNPRLLPAATRNVLAHLVDLYTRDFATSEGPLSQHSTFHKK
jgi:glyoxylase-like metal-dependent hydrolase (beta-lactamase superfamily II)